MNFFRNRSLKQLSIILPGAFLLVILLEIFWLQSHFNHTESVQYQIDFVRSVQLNNERLSFQLNELPQGASLSPATLSLVEQQELHLQLIETGGRISGSDIFLPGLQRLPKITYGNLKDLWVAYKKQILELHSQGNNNERTFALIQAQSLRVSDWLTKLSDDLYDEAAKSRSTQTTAFIVIIATDVFLLFVLIVGFHRLVLSPIKYIEKNTIIHQHTHGLTQNEIGILATQVNEVIEQLRDATDFVKGIGEGKLDMDYKTELDINYSLGKNKLADELIAMQSKLKAINLEDQRRQWANEGFEHCRLHFEECRQIW